MSFFYSKSTRGFYTKEMHGERMPNDVVPVSVDQHAALMKGQESGQEIAPDEDGRPTLRARTEEVAP